MTGREKREMLTNAIIDDIMQTMSDNELVIIRDAHETHFAHCRYEDIESEYKERAIT